MADEPNTAAGVSSDDADSRRVSTDLLQQITRVVHVDELTTREAPWDWDVGAATVRDATFGKLKIPVVKDGEVIWNADVVEAERIAPRDGGMVLVADVTELGWDDGFGDAYALAEYTAGKQMIVDHAALAEQVMSAQAYDGGLADSIGWDADTLNDLLGQIERDQQPLDPYSGLEVGTPPVPDSVVTQPGDVWLLGPHRLVCGDSTDPGVVKVATGGRVVELVHADPPYGMGKEKDGVANDNLYGPKLDAFQMAWWSACRPVLAGNGSVYVWGNPEALWRLWYIGGLCDSERLSFRNEIVWDKGLAQQFEAGQHGAAGLRSYNTVTERCLFFMLGEQEQSNNADGYWGGWEPVRSYLDGERQRLGWQKADIARITGTTGDMMARWFSKSQWSMPTREHYEAFQKAAQDDGFKRDYDEIKRDYDEIKRDYDEIHAEWLATRAPFDNTHDNMTDVWSYPRVTGDERHGHATPKPVDMMARILKSSTTNDGTVLCPFGGTGPELIAAEQTGRTYFGVELSPAYCDVICRRYEQTTGTIPVLESTGEPHSFVDETVAE